MGNRTERWEAEMEAKRAETEERKRREEREFEEKKAEAEERKRREEREFEERKRREALEAEQLELKKQELAHQIDRDKAEDDRRDSSVATGKLFGDAMRASTIRMGADPIDAIPFFRNVEQLFRVYGVPSALQAILIHPFLNEKAKSILGKLSAKILGDYTRLKAALLQEFKLSAKAEVTLGTHAGCMQHAYDRMQPAYDRRCPACRRRRPAFYGVDAGMMIVIIRRE